MYFSIPQLLHFFKILLMYLSNGKGEPLCTSSFLRPLHGTNWATLKPRVGNSIHVSHLGAGTNYWSHCHFLPGSALSGAGSRCSTQVLYCGWEHPIWCLHYQGKHPCPAFCVLRIFPSCFCFFFSIEY